MKRHEVINLIRETIIAHNESIGDLPGYGLGSAESIVEALEKAQMLPPPDHYRFEDSGMTLNGRRVYFKEGDVTPVNKPGALVNIVINGRNVAVESNRSTISFGLICALAFQPLDATVTFQTKSRYGLLLEGQSVGLEEGMVFNCIVTGNS